MKQTPSSQSSATETGRIIALALVAFGVTYSCVERSDDPEPPDAEVKVALEGAAACVTTNADDFLAATSDLQTKVAAWNDSPDDKAARRKAQASWEAAMGIWQTLEIQAFGPAGSSSAVDQGGTVGGQDLRDEIYSWPVINPCRVDQGLVDKVWTGDLHAEPVNARGLDALEYLLFYEGEDSSCGEASTIVTDGTWAALADRDARRAQYALAAAALISDHAQALVDAWAEDEGNFQETFVDAGTSGEFPDQGAALNAVTDALFYIERTVKDKKLMIPLGISDSCATETCPDSFEHPTTGRSKQSIEDNLAGLKQIFEGCGDKAPSGLDALLRNQGADLLADKIQAAVGDVDDALNAIEEDDLRVALADDPQSVNDLYDALKALTDLLKLELPDTLQVNLPSAVGGDND